jgi:hypothetical protein
MEFAIFTCCKTSMLVYLSAPYTSVEDKNHLFECIMRTSGLYMLRNKGEHVVSPLFNHPSVALVPGMGSDYNFWGDYSRELLRKCDKIVVLKYSGWDKSTGVQDEIATASEAGIPVLYLEMTDYM